MRYLQRIGVRRTTPNGNTTQHLLALAIPHCSHGIKIHLRNRKMEMKRQKIQNRGKMWKFIGQWSRVKIKLVHDTRRTDKRVSPNKHSAYKSKSKFIKNVILISNN